MNDFQKKFSQLLRHMLAPEHPLTVGEPCLCGAPGMMRVCHCSDCFQFTPCCATCFVHQHQKMPFHWVEYWNGAFLERKDISELGYVVPFHHENHSGRCKQSQAFDFTLVDLTGVHKTRVSFCDCASQHGKRFDLLLESQIFPATVTQPTTGFTFNLLKDFHLQTLTSKKTPYDYITALRRKTNNAFIDEVPDPYPQFLRAQRLWRVLTMLKRSGQVHDIDKSFPFRRKGNVIVVCFACPEPGFNVPDSQWDDLDNDELGFLNCLMLMADGHFGLQRLAKVDDPDDISFLDGAGLFPPDSEYNNFVFHIKVTCSRFNAVEMQNKMKFKGSIITGVLAIQCNRHVFYISMVDLQKGERYGNADFALAYALRRFTVNRSLQGARFFSRILLSYDVACQYYVHLVKRFNVSFPDLLDIVKQIQLLVPKKHLDGHKDDCKYRFSFNYTQGTGRSHGEGIEQGWFETKQAGGSTRQMNHGHRHDTLNDFNNDWNWVKLQDLARSLNMRLKKAFITRDEKVEHYLGLSEVRGKDNVRKWEKEPTEARMVDGEWESVYKFKKAKLPSQANILEACEIEEKRRQTSETLVGDLNSTTGLARLIHAGLKLEEKQYDLSESIKTGNLTEVQVEDRRSKLTAEILAWRRNQMRLIPQLGSLISSSDAQSEAEATKLFLPSDFTPEKRKALELGSIGLIELELRYGQVNDAVAYLCNTILHGIVLLDTKNRHARGVYMTTRAQNAINTVKSKKWIAAARYRHGRLRILNLRDIDVHEDYPLLRDEDTWAKNAASARNVGDGTSTDSWIWTFGGLKDLNNVEKSEFIMESTCLFAYSFISALSILTTAEKVQWFRARADMERWIEEVDLLQEEFRRVIRGCEKMAEVWATMSHQISSKYCSEDRSPLLPAPSRAGYTAYALQKSAMYRQMAVRAQKAFTDAGGESPSDGETLSEHVLRRRPVTNVDWERLPT
ncbi:hypothetical protein BDN70DRAFT_977471 [Pholiota conissans]|uniref:CxC2-like cysteine cluster KDZ transposase-associated domain-containing protein n=1 Tax=Pholiota conissans TaxID=109636 RepID=A0A9P5YLS8_9AGAR|nr:hypothetical protein BDN70DRAFT_977471 [Pholiota conissans]